MTLSRQQSAIILSAIMLSVVICLLLCWISLCWVSRRHLNYIGKSITISVEGFVTKASDCSTEIEHLPHDLIVKGLSPAIDDGTRREKKTKQNMYWDFSLQYNKKIQSTHMHFDEEHTPFTSNKL